MNYHIQCDVCGGQVWIGGDEESDTNVVNLAPNDYRWDDACQHLVLGGSYTIIGSEPDDEEPF
jgi:hypothetical protein